MVALGIVKELAVFDVLWRLYYDVFPFPLGIKFVTLFFCITSSLLANILLI